MRKLWFESSNGTIFDLNDRRWVTLQHVEGTGIPPMLHQTVVTPNRDGETYLQSMVEARYVLAELTWHWLQREREYGHELRRTFVKAFNAKNGLGRLYYQPDTYRPLYMIDAILETGLEFGGYIGEKAETATLSFRCPNPFWMSAEEQNNITSLIPASAGGLDIPMDIPLDIVGGSGGGGTDTTFVVNEGDVDVYPLVFFTSPAGDCVGPIITNETTGKVFSLPGLTINSTQSVKIDMQNRTVTRDDVNVASYRSADSEHWPLIPGGNQLDFNATSGSVQTIVRWHTQYLGV